jgi:hypothetical protein
MLGSAAWMVWSPDSPDLVRGWLAHIKTRYFPGATACGARESRHVLTPLPEELGVSFRGRAATQAANREELAAKPEAADRRATDGASADGARTAVIRTRETFDAITSEPREIAGLYAYAHLDRLIDLALRVAGDFFARPQLYTQLGRSMLEGDLARLNARTGADEMFLSHGQRQAIYRPLFGDGTVTSDFQRLCDPLLEASAVYAEWAQPTGQPMLRERVRTAHRPFREYLSGLRGASVSWSRKEALPKLADGVAYPIVRDRGVIAVFGLTRPAADDLPYIEDANGDKAVEEMARELEPANASALTRESFSAMQRVALRGAEAIAMVIDFTGTEEDDALDALITRCYTWHAALKAWRIGSGGGPRP